MLLAAGNEWWNAGRQIPRRSRVKRDTTTPTPQHNSVEVLMILDYSIYYRYGLIRRVQSERTELKWSELNVRFATSFVLYSVGGTQLLVWHFTSFQYQLLSLFIGLYFSDAAELR